MTFMSERVSTVNTISTTGAAILPVVFLCRPTDVLVIKQELND